MSNVVLVGGNGYIGREITEQWLNKDSDVEIYVTSRSDRAEVKDARVHHVEVDVNDEQKFDAALPESVDYIVNLTYGSMDALESIKNFAKKHHVKAIGNIGVKDLDVPDMADFIQMKRREAEILMKSEIPVENVEISVAYGKGRNDEIAQAIKAGYLDAVKPISVEIVAAQLINELTKDWREA